MLRSVQVPVNRRGWGGPISRRTRARVVAWTGINPRNPHREGPASPGATAPSHRPSGISICWSRLRRRAPRSFVDVGRQFDGPPWTIKTDGLSLRRAVAGISAVPTIDQEDPIGCGQSTGPPPPPRQFHAGRCLRGHGLNSTAGRHRPPQGPERPARGAREIHFAAYARPAGQQSVVTFRNRESTVPAGLSNLGFSSTAPCDIVQAGNSGSYLPESGSYLPEPVGTRMGHAPVAG
ncbi:hypothetical protein FHS27_003327 [Rhodopirellula rubra]|uniref:Uncharacterized protein n=1 Tax=Aporhodopirellula rubra TaxID=980271 RepID=A0A7W5H5H6_9BACT|nr:hypothetical protein [Aporhodopirellula rubra]